MFMYHVLYTIYHVFYIGMSASHVYVVFGPLTLHRSVWAKLSRTSMRAPRARGVYLSLLQGLLWWIME